MRPWRSQNSGWISELMLKNYSITNRNHSLLCICMFVNFVFCIFHESDEYTNRHDGWFVLKWGEWDEALHTDSCTGHTIHEFQESILAEEASTELLKTEVRQQPFQDGLTSLSAVLSSVSSLTTKRHPETVSRLTQTSMSNRHSKNIIYGSWSDWFFCVCVRMCVCVCFALLFPLLDICLNLISNIVLLKSPAIHPLS